MLLLPRNAACLPLECVNESQWAIYNTLITFEFTQFSKSVRAKHWHLKWRSIRLPAIGSSELLRLPPSHPKQINFFLKLDWHNSFINIQLSQCYLFICSILRTDGGQKGSSKRKEPCSWQHLNMQFQVMWWGKDVLLPPPEICLHRSILLDKDWHRTPTRTLPVARPPQFRQTMKFNNSVPPAKLQIGFAAWPEESGSLGGGKEPISRVLTALLANLPHLRHFKVV